MNRNSITLQITYLHVIIFSCELHEIQLQYKDEKS